MNFSKFLYKTASLCTLGLLLSSELRAQVTTNGGSGLAPTYTSLANAITALNGAAISSPVVITLTGNETAPLGGYSITAQGTAANGITITGATSTITAAAAQTAGSLNDAVFKLVGADFITLQNFTMQENAANTTTAAATNNMTEWGVALLYATTSNGAMNNTIRGNTITLNRTYQNTFGIYANATHTAAAPTTSATAIAGGGNNGLLITNNTVQNTNNGILVLGATAAADQNDGITITNNSVLDYGNTGTFSGFANVSGSVYGVLVRNSKNVLVTGNTITSSNGGMLSGTLRGIFFPAFSASPTGSVMYTIDNNTISLRPGATTISAAGIELLGTSASATTTVSISSNTFTNFGHTVAGASGSFTFINTVCLANLVTVSNNTFNNISVNTTGSVTFVSHSYTMPAAATQTINNNQIVGGFSKTGAGGTIIGFTSGTSSPNGSNSNITNNNLSNITVTGGTAITGIANSDGSGSSPNRTVTGNTFVNWTGGTGAYVGMTFIYIGATSNISNNNISNLNSAGSVTGLTIGNSFAGGNPLTLANNTITGLVSTASTVLGLSTTSASPLVNITGNTITGLSAAGVTANGLLVSAGTVVNISKNKIGDVQGTIATSVVSGLLISGGTTVNANNNIIGDLRAPIATRATDAVLGINITSTTGTSTINVFYNTVFLAATSTGANFSTAAIFHTTNATATTAPLDMRNNIFVNNSTPNGTGNTAAYRRSNATLTNFSANSNRNDFFAPIIFADGTVAHATLAAYQGTVSPRDANSISEAPNFLSLSAASATFLEINPAIPTGIESAAANIAGLTDDFDGNIRQGNGGYVGTGTAPDMGADEFELAVVNCTSVSAATVSPMTSVYCAANTPTHAMVGTVTPGDNGISYQWQVSNTPGGPYSNVVGGSAATATSYTSGVLTAGVYYYVLRTSCSFSSTSILSSESIVTVIANPTVTVSPNAANYCNPGGAAVALTASGATTYSWAPAAGLSATTGTNVSASPATTTTYVVTGTTSGCTGTATANISVLPGVTISPVTATPASVGLGGNSQLSVTGTVSFDATARAYGFAASTGTYTAVTGTSLTLASQDDSGIGNLPIGFTFNYNGAAHTVFGARSNGLIELSQATPALTGFSTNSLATTANCIAPLWDDNNMTGGTIIYVTTGIAPNRVLTVQWTGMHVGGGGSSTEPTINAQVRLYETTNVVELVYGSTSAAFAAASASIGISGAVGNFRSVTPLLPVNTSTSSIVTENTLISLATNFPSGTIYTFTPPVAPTVTYAWSPATFLNNAAIANPLASNVTVTTPYTVTATAPNGCFATANTTVTLVLAFTAQASITSPSLVCQGTTVNLTANPSGGTAPYTYAWSGPNGFSSNLQSPAITNVPVANGGTYTVTITDATTATAVANTSVLTVNPTPSLTLTQSSATYCNPGPGVSITAAGAVTYAWSPAAGLNAANIANPIATPAATTIYSVTGTTNGCTSVANVTVNAAAALVLNPITATPPSVCLNGSSQLTTAAVSNTYSVQSTTYNFETPSGAATTVTFTDPDDGASTTAIPIPFTFRYFNVNYTNLYTFSNGFIELGGNLSSTSTYGAVIPTAANPNNIIAGVWDDLNVTGAGANVRYFTNGTAPNRVFIMEYANVKFYNLAADNGNLTFQIKLFETSNNIEIHVLDVTDPSPSNHFIGIENATGAIGFAPANRNPFTNNISNEAWRFAPATLSYAWSPATFLNSTTIANPLASNITVTTPYSVTATSSNGCSAVAAITITSGAALLAQASITSGSITCASNTVALNAIVTGGGSPYTYSWSGPNGFSSTMQSPSISNVTAAAAGVYNVTVADICLNSVIASSVALTVNPSPSLTLTQSSATYCNPGAGVSVTAAGAVTYAWSPAAGLNATNIANPIATPSATTVYSVTGTGANSCTSIGFVTINSSPAVLLTNITATPANICAGGSSQLTATVASTAGNIVITEVTMFRTGTGATSAYPAYATGEDLVEISNISSVAVDISGYTLADYANNSATAVHPFTFPAGTIIPANGVAVVHLGAGTNDIANRYFNTGGITNNWFSDASIGLILRNGATFVDVVGLGGSAAAYTFEPTLGVNASEWLGFAPNASGLAGVIRTAAIDNNTGSNWTASSAVLPQTIGTYNGGYTFAPITYTYAWSPTAFLNNATIANPLASNVTATTSYTVTATSSAGCFATTTTSISVTSVIATAVVTSNFNGAQVSCFGSANGEATATGSGATAPYTYLWSNTLTGAIATGLAAGTYGVTVTDATGCSASRSVTVTQPTAITASIPSQINVLCNGANTGSATAAATGGTGAYTFVWSNGQTTSTATGLVAGTYSVTATDVNGCTGINSVTISQPAAALLATNTVTNITCFAANDGIITINANGGTTPYTFNRGTGAQGSNVFNGLAVASYIITVTDANGCSTTTTANITQPAAALATTVTATGAGCGGSVGSATATTTGGTAGYSFLWTGNRTGATITGLTAGAYAVTVTDANGCSITGNANVTATISPVTIAAGQTNVLCFAGATGSINANPANGATPYTFAWSNGRTVANNTGLAAGTYTLTVTDANSCMVMGSYTITQPAAALSASVALQTNVSCFAGNNGTISSTAVDGTAPYTYLWTGGATTANITGLTAGTYTLTVTDANGCMTMTSATISQPAAALTASTSTTTVSCFAGNDGTATVTAIGGTGVAMFMWSNTQTTATATGLIANTYTVTATDANGCTTTANAVVSQPTAALTTAAASVTPSCVGDVDGMIMANATGGTAPYMYMWSDAQTTATATGLAAGTYTVTVTDSRACITNAIITVSDPAAITLVVSSTDVLCNGDATGMAMATTAGGTGLFTYTWSNGQTTANNTGLAIGVYTLAIRDANGCTENSSVTINEPTAIGINTSSTDATTCGGADGTGLVVATGGITPYTYIWSNGQTTDNLTNASFGIYTVTVTDDNGCMKDGSVTISEPSGVNVSASSTDVLCFNTNTGTSTAIANGGIAPYMYAWSDGQMTDVATGLAAGTYNVTATDDAGCRALTSVTVTEATPITLSLSSTDATCGACTDGSAMAQVLGGAAPYSFAWSNGSTNALNIGLALGAYTVTITDANGCIASGSVAVSLFVSVDNNSNAEAVKLYPNPTTATVTLENLPTNARIQVINTLGQVLRSYEPNQAIMQMDMSDFSPATYYIQIIADSRSQIIPVVRIR